MLGWGFSIITAYTPGSAACVSSLRASSGTCFWALTTVHAPAFPPTAVAAGSHHQGARQPSHQPPAPAALPAAPSHLWGSRWLQAAVGRGNAFRGSWGGQGDRDDHSEAPGAGAAGAAEDVGQWRPWGQAGGQGQRAGQARRPGQAQACPAWQCAGAARGGRCRGGGGVCQARHLGQVAAGLTRGPVRQLASAKSMHPDDNGALPCWA